MRKQLYLSLIFCLTNLILIQYQASMAQDFAYLPPPVYQSHENDRKELKVVLLSLEKKFGIYFTFESQVILDKYVQSEVTITEDLEQTLMNVLNPFNLKFKRLSDKYYTIYPREERQQKQKKAKNDYGLQRMDSLGLRSLYQISDDVTLPAFQFAISGTVTDENNQPLPGANVIEKGTTNGTTTDASGNYHLNVQDEKSVLIFSFIGYVTLEQPVSGKTIIDVVLSPTVTALEEVIVIGYGTMKKADVTTAVATLTDKEIANRPVMSFAEAMAGQVAGVEIQQSGGQPGGTNVIVRIRGTNSIGSSSDPLYVVDGVPMPNALSAISSNDIEEITILKDVSATAIYGSRGSSGVVIITTKRAKTGAPTISYNSSVGMQQTSRRIPMMGKEDYLEALLDYKNTLWVNRNPTVNKATDSNAVRYAAGATGNNFIIPDGGSNPWGTFKYNILDPNDVAQMADTDWQDEIYRNAFTSQQEISITGGTKETRYIISGVYGRQDGLVINSNYDRFNTRAFVETKLKEKLTVSLQLMGNYGGGRMQAEGRNSQSLGAWGVNLGALTMAPVYPVMNPDGSYVDFKRNPEILGAGQPGFNPVELANNRYQYQKKYGWSASGVAEWAIMSNLNYKFTVNGQLAHNEESFFQPKGMNDYGETLTGTRSYNSQSEIRSYLIQHQLNYDLALGEKHNISVMGGYTVENYLTGSIYVRANDAPSNYVRLVSGTPMAASTGASENALISYLGRVMYNYDQRYLLTGTVRWDGSSRFSPDHKWGSFPSVSAGWNISQEAFMENVRPISDLKIRGGYGISGNNGIGDFAWQGNMGGTWYPVGDPQTALYGITPGSKTQNYDLTWENTKEYNIGFDLGLFANRIFLSGNYYERTSYDLLLNIPTPTITGQTGALVNMGKMRNSGVELMLSTKNMVGDFKWSTDFNIAHNQNVVLALGPDDAPIVGYAAGNFLPIFRTTVGQPLSTFWGYQVEGVYKDDEDLANHVQYRPGMDRPGQLYFKDVNEDGVINNLDETDIGNNYPIFLAGMTNRFSYKNFSLDLQLTGSYGGRVYSIFFREFVKGNNGSRGMPQYINDRWKSPAEPGNGIVPAIVQRGLDGRPSSYWVQDNSYLRIRNLSLGYDFDRELLKAIKISRLKVFVMANNLYTLTSYLGYDPEANTSYWERIGSAGSLSRGADYASYPTARTFTLGVNLTL